VQELLDGPRHLDLVVYDQDEHDVVVRPFR
jgi:hypothetical protein